MPLYVRTVLVTGPPGQVEPAARKHLEHLRELKGRGRLRAAGAFNDGDGFLDIFEADDLLEANRIAESSPLISLGLGAWLLREWTELDAELD